jgi:uncharacterized protein
VTFNIYQNTSAKLAVLILLLSACNESKSVPKNQSPLESSRQNFWKNLPAPTAYVNDFDQLFTNEESQVLDSIIADYDQKTTVQFAIVTLDSTHSSKTNFEALTLHIAKTWGIGQKGKDNGILFGISKDYRKIRIQNGYGIEKIVTDAETKDIIDQYIIPFYKKELYFEGTKNGLLQYIELLTLKTK